MPPKTPLRIPTQGDVARRAGVSISTVSYALRDDSRIAAATRERVRQAAQALDYRPDPVLAALVARRSGRRTSHVGANLAVLVDDRWQATPKTQWHQSFIDGMGIACRRLGYALDILHIQRDLGVAKKPDRILQGRGIRGLILLPLYNPDVSLPLQWDRYAAIAIGYPPASLPLHRVGSDAFNAMQLTCERLHDLGYRRIGLVNPLAGEKRLRYEWLGAMAKEAFLPQPKLIIVPPHLPEDLTKQSLLTWVKEHKPEAIVSNDSQVIDWLNEVGLRVPRDIGVALLNRDFTTPSDASGISQHFDLSGETAVEQLHTLLLRGETGFPSLPKEILMRPHWVDGFSLRSLARRSGREEFVSNKTP